MMGMKKRMKRGGKAMKKRTKRMGGGMMKKRMKQGGKALKKVDAKKNPGLSKLPTEVRNKMGFMKRGGVAKMKAGGKPTVKDLVQRAESKQKKDLKSSMSDFKKILNKKPKMKGGGMMKKRMKRGGKAK